VRGIFSGDEAVVDQRTVTAFHHEAVFYETDDEYVGGMVPEIRSTMARDGAVLVAVGGAKRQLLSEALGAEAEQVRFTDMEALGRNPGCIIPAWREFLHDAGPEPVLGIGEPAWPGRSDEELVECSRHESLLNLAFDGGRAWRLLCPYDAGALEAGVLDEARRNHPYVRSHGSSDASGEYGGRQAILDREDELAAPPWQPVELGFTDGDLTLVRHFTSARARSAGVRSDRVADLVLAVHELVANSLRHGGGRGLLRVWTHEATFVCEIVDAGHIADPLAGRGGRDNVGTGGRGLWIVNHLCDLVQVRSTSSGTVIRLHMAVT
jgi:anti-sigma regulatory factor (Ser/Thr protein kinase)